jgi:hypothetical protein
LEICGEYFIRNSFMLLDMIILIILLWINSWEDFILEWKKMGRLIHRIDEIFMGDLGRC